MKCPKCRTDNPETARFCNSCAAPFAFDKDAVVTETIQTLQKELTRGTTFTGRYEIIEELGKGGMGKVYRVEDRKLKQEVALKLIKPEIASDRKNIERFENELKTARMIAHKNVCRMFDLGESEGSHFITMEFVRGEDLKSMIRMSGQLGTATAIGIAKQICEGLTEAHRLGVVHRDLKPSNIMIDREGQVRIMDFGIARSLQGKGITGAGTMIGTPEYMSPEQVEGKETDQRSDIYSLGILLYEMTTGRLPFEAETPFAVGIKQKSEAPGDPREINPQIPEDLGRLILKCLEKDKENRYQSANDVRTELERIEEGLPATAGAVSARKPPTSKEITVSVSLRKWIVPVVGIVALAAVVIGIWQLFLKKEGEAVIEEKPYIAVLPFKDQNPREDSADLCRETWINIYNKLRGLRKFDVKSRYLVEEYESTDKDPLTVGRELGVSHVLVGEMFIGEEKFEIDAELLNVIDGSTIWGEGFPGKFEEILSIHGEVAEEVVNGLNLALSSEERVNLHQKPTENPEAWRKYAAGRAFFDKRTRENLEKAIEYFEQAIELDSGYARAYSGLADVYMFFRDERARDFANRALALDETLAEAHTSLASVKLEIDWDLKGAEAEYEKALELDPDYATAHHWYGRLLTMLCRHDQATTELERAQGLNPTDLSINRNLGFAYFCAGNADQAIEQLLETLELDPDFPQTKGILSMVYIERSMFQEILELYDYDVEQDNVQLVRLLELAEKDREAAVENYHKSSDSDDPVTGAWIYALLGEGEKALEKLEKAYEDRISSFLYIKAFPGLREYHSSPRFQALLKKMGLD